MRPFALASSILLLLAGCGAPDAREERAPDDDVSTGGDGTGGDGTGGDGSATAERHGERDSVRERPAPAVSCPPSYDAPGPSCDQDLAHLTCSYPEGECYCGEPRRCSGAVLPPQLPTWHCVPREPPCPTLGTACREGDVGCSPWCCGVAVVCVNGVWTGQPVPCPP